MSAGARSSSQWARRSRVARDGRSCPGRRVIASSSINGPRIMRTRSPVACRSSRSTCTSTPTISTSGPRPRPMWTPLWRRCAGQTQIAFSARSAPDRARDKQRSGFSCCKAGVHMRFEVLALPVSIALSLSAAGAVESFRQLKGTEIRSRFAGREFTDDVHWALVFGRDGNLSAFEMTAGKKGTWKVQKDELCLNYGREGLRCYQVWVSGKDVQLRRDGVLPEDGVLKKPAKRAAQ